MAKAQAEQPELKSILWEAANILRGSAVDRTDWKGYILPLLFFKRISDVWDEEHQRMLEEYGEEYPDEHRFQVPEGCHWNDIRETPTNVGTALSRALQKIERANPDTLDRIFGAADWGNREKFTDELLKDLIEGFSSMSLGNNAVDTDVLGDAYEYLVGKFADVNRRNKAGEFYTPRSVVRMMVEILDPKEGESIYDPSPPIEHEELGKADLTELFEEAKTGDTPVMVERIVSDIDEIVKQVRFDGWQNTHAGEREVKKALRKTLFKYKLHQDADLFDRAFGYIRQYY